MKICIICDSQCKTKPVDPCKWFAGGDPPSESFWCETCKVRYLVYYDEENKNFLIINMLDKPDEITLEDWLKSLWAQMKN